MSLPNLIHKVEDYLEYLKEEGARRIEVNAMPRVLRAPSTFEAAQSDKPAAASPERNSAVLPATLEYVTAVRLPECPNGPNLSVLGNKSYFISANRDLLDKMFYAIGYTLTEGIQGEAVAQITLGQSAIDYISGVKTPLLPKRGRWTKRGNLPVLPTFGPDYLAMEPKAKGDVWKDLLSVIEKLGIELPEWSAKYKK